MGQRGFKQMMNLKKVREFIDQAKARSLNEESRQMILDFEEFVELTQMGAQIGLTQEEYKTRLIESHRRFWKSLTKVAKNQGMSPKDLAEKVKETLAQESLKIKEESANDSKKRVKKAKNDKTKV